MKQIEMYRVPSHLGGSFDVSIVKELPDNKVELRIWYGVARTGYWEGWKDFDGRINQHSLNLVCTQFHASDFFTQSRAGKRPFFIGDE